jgi:hypothetical protein
LRGQAELLLAAQAFRHARLIIYTHGVAHLPRLWLLALLLGGVACREKPSCRVDGDCAPPLTCRDTRCSVACSSDSACGQGQRCLQARCVVRPACVSDAECGGGRRCLRGDCRDADACDDGHDCRDGFRCQAQRCTAERRATLAEQVASKGVLAVLGSKGNGDAPAAGDPEGTQARHAYPTVEAPEAVAPATPFSIVVSLTDEKETPEVKVVQGAHDADGRLAFAFRPDETEWKIEAVVSAPGFELRDGRNTASLTLPRSGPSTPVRFELTAVPLVGASTLERPIFVTLWHDGGFLAKVKRTVTVRAAAAIAPVAAEGLVAPSLVPTRAAAIDAEPAGARVPDLTVLLLRNPDPGLREDSLVVVNGPSLQPMQGRYPTPRALPAWLEGQYRRLAGLRTRGVALPSAPTAAPADRVAMVEGFGELLWEQFAPEVFRSAFWRLHDAHPAAVPSILVMTDDPSLPWELMRPVRTRENGYREALPVLGVQALIGRWHVDAGGMARARPPAEQEWSGVTAIAPHYAAERALPAQARELQAIGTTPDFHTAAGRLDDVRKLIGGTPGVVHFAGHGTVEKSGAAASWVLELEDGRLDLLTWRGWRGRSPAGAAPLYFFNACDLGGADGSAGFVDGWAPAVLETGAAGFIGGLWPLGDTGAADFAGRFYGALTAELGRDGSTEVADLLRRARRGFYETGDPTYLAYVFYGDPLLRLHRSGLGVLGGGEDLDKVFQSVGGVGVSGAHARPKKARAH